MDTDYIRTKISSLKGNAFDGSNILDGVTYHSHPFFPCSSHRGDVTPRLEQILEVIDVKGLDGIDLGCNIGGITYGMQVAGACMHGVDYDSASIDIARELFEKPGGPTFGVSTINASTLGALIEGRDLVVWLAQWMWLVKQCGKQAGLEALAEVTSSVPVVIFETSLGDGLAGPEIKQFGIDEELVVETIGQNCDSLIRLGASRDGWHQRKMFVSMHDCAASRLRKPRGAQIVVERFKTKKTAESQTWSQTLESS